MASIAVESPSPPYYSYYSQTTSLRIFYHGETLLFLTPEFHLVHEYLRIDNLNPERSVALSQKLFAGLPEKLLAKAYLKSELSAEEIALLDKTIEQYNKQLEALDVSVYTRYSPPLRIIPMHSIFWISSYPSVDPKFRPPALRNKDDSVYKFSYAPEEAEIYAAGTYPADFFDSARSVDYQLAREIHAQGVKNEPPTSYAWQSRPSPVKIDERGRVSLNGKRFRPLIIRSAFAAKNTD
ncbi:hypothetical protein [Suttonella indologenes]|uniref:hypothetical protein n=1 Tax=Suttonella indologenes TaxID=13276 RepID=UPI001559EB9F|nr:hypothetical protein [Suttonella indologenes]